MEAETYLHATAMAAAAVFGGVVLLTGPRKTAHAWLAAFLGLVAANQAVEAWRTTVTGDASAFGLRLATVFAALDPVALFLFAAAYPRPNALGRMRWIGLVMAAGAALAFLAPWITRADPDPTGRVMAAYHAVYTSVVYGVVLIHFTRLVRESPEERALRLVLVALCIAMVPTLRQALGTSMVLAYGSAFGFGWADTSTVGRTLGLTRHVAGVAVIVWLLLLARRSSPSAARTLRLGAIAGALVTLAINVNTLAVSAFALAEGHPVRELLDPVGRTGAATRWILFSAFASVAVMREGFLDVGARARRRAARVFLAFACVALAGGVLASLGTTSDRPMELAILGVAIVASQAFRALVDHAAHAIYGVPLRADAAGARETYRLAAAQAAKGRDAGRSRADLERLREELGIPPVEARVLEGLADADATAPLAPGVLVGSRYRIDRLLARGATARVFLARDELIGRDVVVKEIAEDPEGERAVEEARAAGAAHHPNVVTVHDLIHRGGAMLLVQEHVAGGDLDELMGRSGKLSASAGIRLLDDVLAGLAVVHARGIVHRDLKPRNVLIDREGRAKIADFGVARLRRGATAGAHDPGGFVGTPEFMAPEQRRGEIASPATDVHAVGLLARRCIQPPLPPGIEAVIARALAADPSARFADAGAMREALRAAQITEGSSTVVSP